MACIKSDDGLYLHSVRFGAGPANDYGQRTMWRSKRASLSGRWTIVRYGTRTGNEVLPTTQTRVAAEPLREFVLIVNDKLIGSYDLPETAYEQGIPQFGNIPTLIKQVAEEEPAKAGVLPKLLPHSDASYRFCEAVTRTAASAMLSCRSRFTRSQPAVSAAAE